MRTTPVFPQLGPAVCLALALLASGCREVSGFQPAVPPEAAALSSAEPRRWTFVVLGDTRDATSETLTGVSPALPRIAEAVAAEKPDLVVHNGDLINGYYTERESPVHEKYREMFDNWKKAMRPIYDFDRRTGIPLYVVRGNHEDGLLLTDADLKAAYRENIAAYMPQNGPDKEKGLTYSVTFGQSTIIALDEYSIKELGEFRGLIDQPWLDDQLTRNRGLFTFVFGHAPAFKVSTFKKGPYPDLYDFPKHRDAFWNSLKRAGVAAYFCGHVHFYCRVTKDGIPQILVGNGGANRVAFNPREVDAGVTLDYPKGPMPISEMKDGYLLVTVDETTRTIGAVQKLWNEQTDAWENGDTFAISPSSDGS